MLMFAQIRASTVAAARTEALPVSVRRKLRSGVSIRRTQAVLPANGPAVSSAVSSSTADAAAAAMSSAETSIVPAASGDDSLIPSFFSQASGVGDAPQEPPGPFVRRLAEQQSGWCLFHDLPVGQETHPAGDVAREAHLMRGDQHRHPALGQFPDNRE